MSISADEIAAHSDKDHGVRDVDAFLVVAHEAAPSRHPAEGALDNPAARQDFEALLVVGSADNLYHEVQVGGLASGSSWGSPIVIQGAFWISRQRMIRTNKAF